MKGGFLKATRGRGMPWFRCLSLDPPPSNLSQKERKIPSQGNIRPLSVENGGGSPSTSSNVLIRPQITALRLCLQGASEAGKN